MALAGIRGLAVALGRPVAPPWSSPSFAQTHEGSESTNGPAIREGQAGREVRRISPAGRSMHKIWLESSAIGDGAIFGGW